MQAKYVHTNLVARDWRRLATFYERVFGCVPVPPERDLSGDALAAATGVPGAHLRGIHLRLPGHGAAGPTLEVFQYEPAAELEPGPANRRGFGHLAFQVADVSAAVTEVLAHGGAAVGTPAPVPVSGAGVVTFAYVRDPEGNILELQSWSPA
jgi:catechol 2,3-dioxygenase-like lactoylglutathione lyase family enzyme